jgi:tetratricopeptide (TPR) repeat protein
MMAASVGEAQTASQNVSEGSRKLAEKLLALPLSQLESADILLRENLKSITMEFVNHLIGNADQIPSAERSLFIYKIALEAARLSGYRKLEGSIWYKIGGLMIDRDEFDEANEALMSALRIWEQTKSEYDLVVVLSDLGALCTYKGEYQQAKEYSARSLEIAETLPVDKKDASILIQIAAARKNLGLFHRWRGDYSRAIQFLMLALAQYQNLKLQYQGLQVVDYIAEVLAILGKVHRDTGDYIQSLKYFNDALSAT